MKLTKIQYQYIKTVLGIYYDQSGCNSQSNKFWKQVHFLDQIRHDLFLNTLNNARPCKYLTLLSPEFFIDRK